MPSPGPVPNKPAIAERVERGVDLERVAAGGIEEAIDPRRNVGKQHIGADRTGGPHDGNDRDGHHRDAGQEHLGDPYAGDNQRHADIGLQQQQAEQMIAAAEASR